MPKGSLSTNSAHLDVAACGNDRKAFINPTHLALEILKVPVHSSGRLSTGSTQGWLASIMAPA